MAIQLNNRNSGAISKKKASTEFAIGDFVTVDANGFLIPGGSGPVKGICNETISSTDSDYASTRDLNFSGFKHDDEFEIPVATGGPATQTNVGECYDVDSVALGSIELSASSNNQIEVTRIINANLVHGKIVVQVT
jgi:hypothetical protein